MLSRTPSDRSAAQWRIPPLPCMQLDRPDICSLGDQVCPLHCTTRREIPTAECRGFKKQEGVTAVVTEEEEAPGKQMPQSLLETLAPSSGPTSISSL